jgi:hypothetical protein
LNVGASRGYDRPNTGYSVPLSAEPTDTCFEKVLTVGDYLSGKLVLV